MLSSIKVSHRLVAGFGILFMVGVIYVLVSLWRLRRAANHVA
jgi:CHASE3 domain sensor protein